MYVMNFDPELVAVLSNLTGTAGICNVLRYYRQVLIVLRVLRPLSVGIRPASGALPIYYERERE